MRVVRSSRRLTPLPAPRPACAIPPPTTPATTPNPGPGSPPARRASREDRSAPHSADTPAGPRSNVAAVRPILMLPSPHGANRGLTPFRIATSILTRGVDGFDLHVRTQIFSHGCSRLDTDFLVHAIGWMSVWRRLRSEERGRDPRQLRQTVQPIFVLGLRPVDPGVMDVDADAVLAGRQ